MALRISILATVRLVLSEDLERVQYLCPNPCYNLFPGFSSMGCVTRVNP
jgi:hypothetical protein